MAKNIGIDLGTNSLGINQWDKNITGTLQHQISSSVDIFRNGVNKGSASTRESSLAAERRSSRSPRHRFRSVRERKQATLKHLIKHGYCPLGMEELNGWRFSDADKGYNRRFPSSETFMQWINLDFDGDGKADYTSAYELRNELVTCDFDFSNPTDCYKLGRALYHIACHRGFKSSKGEKAGEETLENDSSDILSEQKKSSKLAALMAEKELKTIGQAFYYLECNGNPDTPDSYRVRNSEYAAIRKQYEDEIDVIFDRQGLDKTSDFYIGIMSRKKHEGTIFYKKPLSSQKGNIARCFLEPDKPRCYKSHPEFEEFRALQLINNIRIKETDGADWEPLSEELRSLIYTQVFQSSNREYFSFSEIREYIERQMNVALSKERGTINYNDLTSVSACPVTVRLMRLFGKGISESYITPDGSPVRIEDIWHNCIFAEDEEWIRSYATDRLGLDVAKTKEFMTMWRKMPEGYSEVSLKALRKINVMLRQGMYYSDAVMFAKLPEVMGAGRYEEIKDSILDIAESFRNKYDEECHAVMEENRRIREHFDSHPEEDYRTSSLRYKERPNKLQSFKNFLCKQFPDVKPYMWYKLYHHSDLTYYPEPPRSKTDGRLYLDDPVRGRLMPPAVKHALFVLKHKMNSLIESGEIYDPEHTRIVVETAREMCDANTKWAIDTFNKRRENENKEFAKLMEEICKKVSPSEEDKETMRLLIEQGERMNECDEEVGSRYQIDVLKDKYTLWKEQNYISIYTGHVIKLSELFTEKYDIEHTIPISLSFDDSMENKTICEAHYNRKIKKNQLPVDMPNYSEAVRISGYKYDCTPIQDSIVLQNWSQKVERLERQVAEWSKRAKRAALPEVKNDAIRQKILYLKELQYWSGKLKRFHMTEVPDGFRNNQLNDTRIITRYAFHYLKSVFPKVFVEKGSTTAIFRKILGIDPSYDKLDKKRDDTQFAEHRKDRSKHYHHAVDALVLSLIPHAKLRDEIIELHYKKQEAKKVGNRTEFKELSAELVQKLNAAGINLREVAKAVARIKKEIIITHEIKDNKMARNNRRIRVRGKATGQWSRGDVAKGRLHKDKIYGAVTLPVMTEDGPMMNDKRFVYSDVVGNLTYVIREPLTKITDTQRIVDPLVRKSIECQMKKYGIKSLSSADNKPMWMMRFKDDKGNDIEEIIKHDRHGNPLSPIRHVRCYAPVKSANIIPVSPTERTSQKQCVHIADRSHKLMRYAEKGDYICCIVYVGINNRGKEERAYYFMSDFELANEKRMHREQADRERHLRDFVSNLEAYQQRVMSIIDNKGNEKERINMRLEHVLISGMVLRLRDDGSGKSVSERTFIMRNCNYFRKCGVIWLSHHSEANITENLIEVRPSKFRLYEVVE